MMIFKDDITIQSQIFNLFIVAGLKRKIAVEHKVQDDSETKCINFLVIMFHLKYLWSNETRSSCKFLFLREILQLIFVNPKPKIYNLDLIYSFFILCHFNLHNNENTMIFSGLRSLWMIPISLLRQRIASVSCLKTSAA